jgi:uncharacterized protein YpuA (DUF1002 family)
MDIKGTAEKIIKDKDLTKNPIKAVENATGKDLPDEKIKSAVSKVAKKVDTDKVKDKIGDVVDKIKKLEKSPRKGSFFAHYTAICWISAGKPKQWDSKGIIIPLAESRGSAFGRFAFSF